MRLTLLVTFVVWCGGWHGSAAFADPAPDASDAPDASCSVTITAAPDPVRSEIATWVAAERRCSHTLTLRIEASKAGLRVFARDERGLVRERVVPDDQSIGALIVSWIASEAPAEPAPVIAAPAALAPSPLIATPEPPPPPLPPPTPTPTVVEARPVSAVPARDGVAASVALGDSRQEWLTLAGALSVSEDRKYGLRGELDLTSRGWWSLGVFASQIESSQAQMAISMTSVGGFFAAESTKGDWQLRAQVGLGGTLVWLRNYCDCDQMGVGARLHQFTPRPISELSVLVGHALGARWSLAGGALLTAALIDYGLMTQDRVSVMVFAGFRNRF